MAKLKTIVIDGKEIAIVSIAEAKRRGLGVTTKHTGKMRDNWSISTSAVMNPFCRNRARIKNGKCICTKCYANRMVRMYRNLENMLARNTNLLTTQVLDFVPDFSKKKIPYARLEAFGDVINCIQEVNYLNTAEGNPEIGFAQWTKNPAIIAQTFKKYGRQKPKNLRIGYSSPIIDHPVSLEEIQKVFPFIDFVFTVWSSEEVAKKAGCEINCGKRHCMTCKLCYEGGKVNEINELLK